MVRDGQLGTQDPTTQGASASASLRLPSRISSPSGAAVVLELGQGRFAGAEDTSVWAQNGSTMANSFAVDAVSDATVESVLRSRRRFLRAQKLVDGDLMVDAQPTLNPVQVLRELGTGQTAEQRKAPGQLVGGDLCSFPSVYTLNHLARSLLLSLSPSRAALHLPPSCAPPRLQPQVIEDLADALLEEMLHEQATGKPWGCGGVRWGGIGRQWCCCPLWYPSTNLPLYR